LDWANLGKYQYQALGADDFAAEVLADALVPEADPEQRLLACKGLDHGEAHACFVRRARPRRDHHTVRIERECLFDGDGIVAKYLLLHPKLAKVLHQIISERVEIIDYEKHDWRIKI
jgi:hypothetical protein